MCATCQQQGRQLRRVRLSFSMGALNAQAPGLFNDPQVDTCLLCNDRVRQLAQKLRAAAGPVRSCELPWKQCTVVRSIPAHASRVLASLVRTEAQLSEWAIASWQRLLTCYSSNLISSTAPQSKAHNACRHTGLRAGEAVAASMLKAAATQRQRDAAEAMQRRRDVARLGKGAATLAAAGAKVGAAAVAVVGAAMHGAAEVVGTGEPHASAALRHCHRFPTSCLMQTRAVVAASQCRSVSTGGPAILNVHQPWSR